MVVEELKLRNATVPYHLRDPLEILGERDFQPARQIPEDVQVHNHLPCYCYSNHRVRFVISNLLFGIKRIIVFTRFLIDNQEHFLSVALLAN